LQGTGRLEFLVALGGALRGLVALSGTLAGAAGDRPWCPWTPPPAKLPVCVSLTSHPVQFLLLSSNPYFSNHHNHIHARSLRHHFLSTQGFLYSCRSLLSLFVVDSSPLLLLVGDCVVDFLVPPPIAPSDSSRQTRATPSRKNTRTRTQPSSARSPFHPACARPLDNVSQSTTSFFLLSRIILNKEREQ
jgi:hypothetical protein